MKRDIWALSKATISLFFRNIGLSLFFVVAVILIHFIKFLKLPAEQSCSASFIDFLKFEWNFPEGFGLWLLTLFLFRSTKLLVRLYHRFKNRSKEDHYFWEKFILCAVFTLLYFLMYLKDTQNLNYVIPLILISEMHFHSIYDKEFNNDLIYFRDIEDMKKMQKLM